MEGFFDIAVARLDGTPDLLGPLRGRLTLAVNVASRCGLTPQYEGLEQLQRELAAENFTVVGFPCNQFAGQEPGSPEEIAAFCRTTYGVSFPLSAKLDVNGPGRHPVYRFLTSPATGIAGTSAGTSRSSWWAAMGASSGATRPRRCPRTAALCRTSPTRCEPMRESEFLVLGAGAMGSIIAAHLLRAGHEVALLARGARAAQLARAGLTLRGLAEFTVPVAPLTDPAALRRAGTLIVATKTPGTAAALAALPHVALECACSVQNGVLKDEQLAAAFGRVAVLGALADTSGELLPDGAVLFTRNVNILVGELDGSVSVRATRLAATLEAAGVHAAARPQIVSLEWSKFCGWIALTALAVSTRAVTWKFLTDPDGARLLVQLLREMGALAAALGIPLTDESILPVARLCAASEAEAVAILEAIGERYRREAPQHRLSALQDAAAGRALEVHETFGDALARARARSLRLPLLEYFHALLVAIDRIGRGAS